MKSICLLITISLLVVSCDPGRDNNVFNEIDKQADEFLENYSGLMTEQECEDFKESIGDIKGYIWQQRSNGINPSRGDIANYIYDMETTSPSPTDKQAFASLVENNMWSGDQTAIINKLAEESYYSTNMRSILHQFNNYFDDVDTYQEAYYAIDSMRNYSSLSTLGSTENGVFQKAMNFAELAVCNQEGQETELTSNEITSRSWCEECTWTLHWVFFIISIVVTVVSWLLAVITLGISTLVTSTVLLAVWTATWVLTCILVWCDQELCPQGQEAFCEGSFSFDVNIPACVRDRFANNDFQFSDCILSPKPLSGICPSGSTSFGLNCLWECLTQTPVINQNNDWQIAFTCR